ncbi:hypothetical protein FQR65_LT04572 [Abscondita terminalis]|nr:hypothetical protein FQR65_LT04572 [Abscondita terminalis]
MNKPYVGTLEESCTEVRKRLVIAITTLGGILICFVVASFACSFCKYRKKKLKDDENAPKKKEVHSIEFSISSDDGDINDNEKADNKVDDLKEKTS